MWYTRRYIVVDLWRLGDKNIVPKLKDIVDMERSDKTAHFWVTEMQTLINALKNK